MPLNVSTAQQLRNYKVGQALPARRSQLRWLAVPVRQAVYDPTTDAVTLTLGQFNPKRPLQLTISGIISNDTPVAAITTTL
jgi:hypothetical protein